MNKIVVGLIGMAIILLSTWSSALAGAALQFDGQDDLVTFGSVQTYPQFTIEAWIKPKSLSGSGNIVRQGPGPNDTCAAGMGLFISSESGVCGSIDVDGCDNGGAVCSKANILNKWSHVATTYDGHTARFYLNGIQVDQADLPFDPDGYMTAGAAVFFNGPQGFYDGDLDELRIWNRARSGEELQASMSCLLSGRESGLVGYWRFDEGSGQTVNDVSMTGTNGVLGASAAPEASDPTWTDGAPLGSLCAASALENPEPDLTYGSITVVSGWICEAGRVDIQFDNRPMVRAAYGTSRGDTASVCGDSNNGFGLLYNLNLLGDGLHTLRVFADGVEFASRSFSVATLGTEFLHGAAGRYTLHDFDGKDVVVEWREGLQGFTIVGTE